MQYGRDKRRGKPHYREQGLPRTHEVSALLIQRKTSRKGPDREDPTMVVWLVRVTQLNMQKRAGVNKTTKLVANIHTLWEGNQTVDAEWRVQRTRRLSCRRGSSDGCHTATTRPHGRRRLGCNCVYLSFSHLSNQIYTGSNHYNLYQLCSLKLSPEYPKLIALHGYLDGDLQGGSSLVSW